MKLLIVGHQFTDAKSGISAKTGKEYSIPASIKLSCLRKVSDPSIKGLTCKTISIPSTSPFHSVLVSANALGDLNGLYLDVDLETNNGYDTVTELEILDSNSPFKVVFDNNKK